MNVTGNGADFTAADGKCETASGKCTLYAAIEQANAIPGVDSIGFRGGMFNGSVATGTIHTSGLPVISEGVVIDGRNCGTATVPEPCVGLQAHPRTSLSALRTTASGVQIHGLAITDMNVGIRTDGGTVQVTNTWFGHKLDESAEPNDIGILLRGDGSVIGGISPSERNVFADNTRGVEILDGDYNRLLGNYFGVGKDGTAAGVNGNEVAIVLFSSGTIGNQIGTTVSPFAASTPECDGGCNVISRSTGHDFFSTHSGIELGPAVNTTIRGNFVGLDAGGTADYGNRGDGIQVGRSDNTTIGGPSPGDRNVIAGNELAGIRAPANASGLTVENNFLGLDSSGQTAVPDGVNEAVLASGGAFTDNRIAGNGVEPVGSAVTLLASESPMTVSGNILGLGVGGQALSLPDRGLTVASAGNLISGNTVANAGAAGIRLTTAGSRFNIVQGNFVGTLGGNLGPGITIDERASGNLIGGTTQALENVISKNGSDAIKVVGDRTDYNRILRNRGGSNGGLFIDLHPPNGPGNDPVAGPNIGIQAPTIDVATATSASGTSRPRAKVQVFATNSTGRNVKAFLGTASADLTGAWSLTYPSQPAGSFIMATQAYGLNSSEMSEAVPTPASP